MKIEIITGADNNPVAEFFSSSSTPETDDLARGNHVVPTEWAQRLERERDELKEQLGQAMEIAEDFCGLVCYGMGTRPEDWSIENTRDARRTINWFHRLQGAVKK